MQHFQGASSNAPGRRLAALLANLPPLMSNPADTGAMESQTGNFNTTSIPDQFSDSFPTASLSHGERISAMANDIFGTSLTPLVLLTCTQCGTKFYVDPYNVALMRCHNCLYVELAQLRAHIQAMWFGVADFPNDQQLVDGTMTDGFGGQFDQSVLQQTTISWPRQPVALPHGEPEVTSQPPTNPGDKRDSVDLTEERPSKVARVSEGDVSPARKQAPVPLPRIPHQRRRR